MKSLEASLNGCHSLAPRFDIEGIGYLYFHAAPDRKSFHQECVRRVKNLHTSDCLRANK
jgi:hypothetical protein